MGRADYLEEGSWNARCSMCNAKRKSSDLVKNWQGQWRCPLHNEPRHPQDFVRGVPDIQAAPWTQQPGVVANSTAYLVVEESETSLNLSTLFTDTYTGSSGQVGTSGITTVIITIQPGNSMAQVVITSLVTGTGWPAGVTTLIINIMGGAIVLAYQDTSGLDVTENVFGGRLVTSLSFTLTAGHFNIPATYDEWGLSTNGIGSISPTTLQGYTINTLMGAQGSIISPNPATELAITGSAVQTLFTSLTLNGNTYTSASATYAQAGGSTLWVWASLAISATGSYPVTIVL